MADTPQTLSLVVNAQEYRDEIVRKVNRRVTLLKLLEIRAGSGTNCSWVTEGDGAIGENHTDGADAVNFGSDAQAGAVAPWGLYRSNFHVTKLAMDAAGSASSPAGNRKLWARNQMNAVSKLADTIEIAAFGGAGTGTTIGGLDVAIGDNTNTYAGIDKTADTTWQSTVVTPGSPTALTFDLIRSDLGAVGDKSGEAADIAVCGTDVFNKISGLFDSGRRWGQVNTNRGSIALDNGYEGIEIDGCMFVKARRATANTLYYLNTDYVRFEYLPDTEFPAEVYNQVQADDGYGSMPLGFSYSMLSKNGPASRAQVLAQMQLVVEKPSACGFRNNILV